MSAAPFQPDTAAPERLSEAKETPNSRETSNPSSPEDLLRTAAKTAIAELRSLTNGASDRVCFGIADRLEAILKGGSDA